MHVITNRWRRNDAPFSSDRSVASISRLSAPKCRPAMPLSVVDLSSKSATPQPTCFAEPHSNPIPSCFQTMKKLTLSYPLGVPSLDNHLAILSFHATRCRNSCPSVPHQVDHAVARPSGYPLVSQGLDSIDSGAQRFWTELILLGLIGRNIVKRMMN